MAVHGLPELKADMPESLHAFNQYCEQITSTDGVILYKNRVVTPTSLRNDVLSALHAAHQGISMMTLRPESSISFHLHEGHTWPPRRTATTTIGLHPHSLQCRLSLLYLSSTLSRQYVLTSLSTEGFTTLWSWTVLLEMANNFLINRWCLSEL